jgi:hypothetical protein
MPPAPPILNYETPRRAPTLFSRLKPAMIARVGLVITVIGVIIPYDIGSGSVVVNPLRRLACAGAVFCGVCYFLLRLSGDPQSNLQRTICLSTLFFITIFFFVMAHISVSGRTSLPPVEWRFLYWRMILGAGTTMVLTVLYCLFVRRAHRSPSSRNVNRATE